MSDIKFGINITASAEKAKKAINDVGVASKKVGDTVKNKVQHSFAKFGQTLKDNAEKADNLKRKLESVGRAGKALAIGAGVVTASLGALAVASLKAAGTVEQQRIAFKGLLGTYEEADKVITRIRKEAAITPFDIEGLTTMTQQLTTITKDGQKAVDILLDIGDAVSISGKDVNEMRRVILNIQQVASTGKITALDIRQFQSAIPIFNDILANAGLTVSMLQEAENASELLFDAFNKAAQEGGIAFNGMAMQSKSLNGLISTLKDNFKGLIIQLGEELLPIVKPIITFFIGILDVFQNLPKPLKTATAVFIAVGIALAGIATGLGIIISLIPTLLAGLTALGISMNIAFFGIPAILALISTGVVLAITNFDKLKVVAKNTGIAFKNAFGLMKVFVLNAFDRIIMGVNKLVLNAVKKIDKLVQVLNKIPGVNINVTTNVIQGLEKNISQIESKIKTRKFEAEGFESFTPTNNIEKKEEESKKIIQTEKHKYKSLLDIFDEYNDAITKKFKEQLKMQEYLASAMTKAWDREWDHQLDVFGNFTENMKNLVKQMAFDYLDGLQAKVIAQTAADFAAAVGSKNLVHAGVVAAQGAAAVTTIQGAKGAIAGLETGGIVTGNTIAELGEKNKKEAVIPLERDDSRELLREVAGGGNSEQTIYNYMILDGDQFDLMTEKITNNQSKLQQQGRI